MTAAQSIYSYRYDDANGNRLRLVPLSDAMAVLVNGEAVTLDEGAMGALAGVLAERTLRRPLGIGHTLAEGHDADTCPDCVKLPRRGWRSEQLQSNSQDQETHEGKEFCISHQCWH